MNEISGLRAEFSYFVYDMLADKVILLIVMEIKGQSTSNR
jgi:hypothetical protein